MSACIADDGLLNMVADIVRELRRSCVRIGAELTAVRLGDAEKQSSPAKQALASSARRAGACPPAYHCSDDTGPGCRQVFSKPVMDLVVAALAHAQERLLGECQIVLYGFDMYAGERLLAQKGDSGADATMLKDNVDGDDFHVHVSYTPQHAMADECLRNVDEIEIAEELLRTNCETDRDEHRDRAVVDAHVAESDASDDLRNSSTGSNGARVSTRKVDLTLNAESREKTTGEPGLTPLHSNKGNPGMDAVPDEKHGGSFLRPGHSAIDCVDGKKSDGPENHQSRSTELSAVTGETDNPTDHLRRSAAEPIDGDKHETDHQALGKSHPPGLLKDVHTPEKGSAVNSSLLPRGGQSSEIAAHVNVSPPLRTAPATSLAVGNQARNPLFLAPQDSRDKFLKNSLEIYRSERYTPHLHQNEATVVGKDTEDLHGSTLPSGLRKKMSKENLHLLDKQAASYFSGKAAVGGREQNLSCSEDQRVVSGGKSKLIVEEKLATQSFSAPESSSRETPVQSTGHVYVGQTTAEDIARQPLRKALERSTSSPSNEGEGIEVATQVLSSDCKGTQCVGAGSLPAKRPGERESASAENSPPQKRTKSGVPNSPVAESVGGNSPESGFPSSSAGTNQGLKTTIGVGQLDLTSKNLVVGTDSSAHYAKGANNELHVDATFPGSEAQTSKALSSSALTCNESGDRLHVTSESVKGREIASIRSGTDSDFGILDVYTPIGVAYPGAVASDHARHFHLATESRCESGRVDSAGAESGHDVSEHAGIKDKVASDGSLNSKKLDESLSQGSLRDTCLDIAAMNAVVQEESGILAELVPISCHSDKKGPKSYKRSGTVEPSPGKGDAKRSLAAEHVGNSLVDTAKNISCVKVPDELMSRSGTVQDDGRPGKNSSVPRPVARHVSQRKYNHQFIVIDDESNIASHNVVGSSAAGTARDVPAYVVYDLADDPDEEVVAAQDRPTQYGTHDAAVAEEPDEDDDEIEVVGVAGPRFLGEESAKALVEGLDRSR
jgi:hypothetical protein